MLVIDLMHASQLTVEVAGKVRTTPLQKIPVGSIQARNEHSTDFYDLKVAEVYEIFDLKEDVIRMFFTLDGSLNGDETI